MIFNDTTELEKHLADKADREITKQIDTIDYTKQNFPNNRSYLMLSAHQIKHLNRLDRYLADTVIINLEDGVAPSVKKSARALAALFISRLNKRKNRIVVRVNPLDKGGIEDIALMNTVKPDAIRVAKISTVQEAKQAVELINNDIEIHFSIETAEAFHNLAALRCDKRITTYYLGILDLLADLHLSQSIISISNPTFLTILSQFLLQCKITAIHPVGFTYQEYKNLLTYEAYCSLQKSLGYSSVSCISPKQVLVANRIFSSTTKECLKAKEIVRLFETSKIEGVTGFSHPEYGFIDEPIYKGALVTLERCQED
jgi:citrate lyase subunit beta / citryl-CoA lyase